VLFRSQAEKGKPAEEVIDESRASPGCQNAGRDAEAERNQRCGSHEHRRGRQPLPEDLRDGQAGGTGAVQVADVRVVKPITIAVVNPSFEQPNASAKQLFAPPAIRFESVPGWSTDKEPKYSCIRKDAKPSQGIWAAFLWGGDPSIWQITDHTVVLGEAFQLDVDSAVVLGAVKDGVGNLQISLCYLNDAGKRVTLASKSFAMPVTVKNYSLSISSDQARAAAGRKLGIEIVNVRDNVIGVDNVRLKTK